MSKSLTKLLAERGLKQRDLALGCSVNKSTVSRWAERGVPPERVREVERVTGIPREEIRPDIFADEVRA